MWLSVPSSITDVGHPCPTMNTSAFGIPPFKVSSRLPPTSGAQALSSGLSFPF